MKRDFPTADVLSAVAGVLVSPNGIGGVYEVLNFMTGESVFTHQLPRISREAGPVVLKLYPQLALAFEESENVTAENWRHWHDIWIERYGPTLAVPRMTIGEHERIDALTELAEHIPPDRIVIVDSGSKP